MKVLEQYEFVRRGSDRLYRLGPQVVQLGLIALRGMSLYEMARLTKFGLLVAEHARQISSKLGVLKNRQ